MEVINLSDDDTDVFNKTVAEGNVSKKDSEMDVQTIDLTEVALQDKDITINEDLNLKCICANEKKTLLHCKKECFPPLPSPLVRILIIYLSKLYSKRQNAKFRNHLLKTYGYKSFNNDVWTVIDKWCCLLDIKKASQGKYFLCSKKTGKIILPVEHYKDAVLNEHINPSRKNEHRNFEDTYKVLDQKYSLGLDNFGMSKVFVYFYVKACSGCRMDLPSYDAILSKNYSNRLEQKLFKVKPMTLQSNADINEETIEIADDDFKDIMEAPNEAFTKFPNEEKNLNIENGKSLPDKTKSSLKDNEREESFETASYGNKSGGDSLLESSLANFTESDSTVLKFKKNKKTNNVSKALQNSTTKNKSKSKKKKRKSKENDNEEEAVNSPDDNINTSLSPRRKRQSFKVLFSNNLEYGEKDSEFDKVNLECDRANTASAMILKEKNFFYSENENDDASTKFSSSNFKGNEEPEVESVESRISLLVKYPNSNKNKVITLVASSAATANKIFNEINILQNENEISTNHHENEIGGIDEIFEITKRNETCNAIATDNVNADSSCSKVKIEDYYSHGDSVLNQEQDYYNKVIPFPDVKNIFDDLSSTSDMIAKSSLSNYTNVVGSQHISPTYNTKMMSKMGTIYNNYSQKIHRDKDYESEMKNSREEDYYVNSLPTFAWPTKETSTVWHDLCNLAEETNSYVKLSGIINEIGLDLPAALNGDVVSSDAVNTKLFCALEVIKTLKESTKMNDVSIDTAEYEELIKGYCSSSHRESFLYDMDILSSMNRSIVCDKNLHKLTQLAVAKLGSQKDFAEQINFDEALELFETLPIEELQYYSHLTREESSEKEINFTIDERSNI